MVTKKAYVLFYKRRNCPSISIYHKPEDLNKAKHPLLYKVPLPEIDAHHQNAGPPGGGGAGGNNDEYSAAAGMNQAGAAANNNMAAGPAQAWMDNNNQNDDVPQGMMGGPQDGMPDFGAAGADVDVAGAGVAGGIDNPMNQMWEEPNA